MFSRVRIRHKFLAGNILIVILGAAFFGVVVPARERMRALEVAEHDAASLAEMVALGVGVGLQLSELPVVASTFEWARRNPDLVFITVADPTGQEFATFNPAGRTFDLVDPPVTNEPELRTSDDLIQVATAIRYQDQRLGTLWLLVSLESIDAQVAADQRTAILVSLLILTIGIALSFALASRIVGPLEHLREVADRVAGGDYDTPVAVESTDEVGALAQAFDVMVRRLRDSLAELAVQAEELANARDAALDATRAKSDFLATMSHEIRTPMNGVLGMLELLKDKELEPQSMEYAEMAHRSAEALLSIINDILDFSKIEAGKLEIENIDFDLRTVVEEVCALLANRAEAKGLELVCGVDPQAPRAVTGDPTRIRQILLNLAGNALKFTEEGEVVVRADVVEREGDDVFMRFSVRDTGIGISEEEQTRLFQAFAQADSSTTRKFGGTGLGLAISRRLVTLMGGDIGITSAPGEGSTFWFTVPLGESDSYPEGGRLETLHGTSVFIVDDNETNRSILSHQLEAWGVRVWVAEDGPMALDVLRGAHERGQVPDAAVLDMQMPGMDGIALAKVIHADPRFADMKLLLLTSVSMADSKAARSAGLSAVLAKPVRQLKLFESLASVMARPDPADVAATPKDTAPDTSGELLSAHVLLVEDNKINQHVAQAILAKLGHTVDLAENGEQAVAAVAHTTYDIVLMDCQMPVMDGYSATEEIRRRETGKRHTIIAMTAGALESDRERCFAVGMDDYVAKPFKAAELQAILQKWLSRES